MSRPGQASSRNHQLNLTKEQREEKRLRNHIYYLKNRTCKDKYKPRNIIKE